MFRVEQIMGMPIEIDVRDSGVNSTAIDGAFAWFRWADAVFSTYRADSQISRLNAGYPLDSDASETVQGVLRRCEELKIETGGYFDIATEQLPIPVHSADGAATRRGVDPSGLVKGWSVDRAGEILREGGRPKLQHQRRRRHSGSRRRFARGVVEGGHPAPHRARPDRGSGGGRRSGHRNLRGIRARAAHSGPIQWAASGRRSVGDHCGARFGGRRRLRDGGICHGRGRASLDDESRRVRIADDSGRTNRFEHPWVSEAVRD